MRSSPFARANAMMAQVAAIIAITASPLLQQQKIAALGTYESRGKGEGVSNRRPPGARMAHIRAARKARNVRRHRATLKG